MQLCIKPFWLQNYPNFNPEKDIKLKIKLGVSDSPAHKQASCAASEVTVLC